MRTQEGDFRPQISLPARRRPERRHAPADILVYEPKPVHDGRCSVLRLGGQLELLTPEELQQALEQTRAGIR